MQNEDYFRYIETKSFEEKLRAFGEACESMVRHSMNADKSGIDTESRKYYLDESHAQSERASFLFKNLLKDYEEVQNENK